MISQRGDSTVLDALSEKQLVQDMSVSFKMLMCRLLLQTEITISLTVTL